MNKKNLIEMVAEKHELTKKGAECIVNDIFNTMRETLVSGEEVDINNFGKFTIKERAQRTGVNPRTKETVIVPASKSVSFKATKGIRDELKAK